MRLTHRLVSLLLPFLLALVLAGCGGGSSSSPSSSTRGDTTAAPSAPTSVAAPATQAVASTPDVGAPPSTPAKAAATSGTVVSGQAPKSEAGEQTVTLQLPAGWSIVSFPLARLDEVRGLTHQLYTWRDGALVSVDAGEHPEAVDTRFGWLAYTEAGGTVTVVGVPQRADVVEIPLQPGWNLVGNPLAAEVTWSTVRAAQNGADKNLLDVIAATREPGDAWLLNDAYGLNASGPFVERLDSATLATTQGRWVFAWTETVLEMSLSAAPAVKVGVQSAGTTGAVSGKVTSSTGTALKGAQVRLDSGQSTLSLSDGTFYIANVPAGTRTITVSLLNYRTASGTITVYAGQTRSVLVSITSTVSTNPTGTMYVSGYAWTYGGRRYYVSRIEVSEYGNPSKYWSNSWWSDLGYSRYDLTCSSANLNKSHTIRITWKNASGTTYTGTWYRTPTASGQTFYFYNP